MDSRLLRGFSSRAAIAVVETDDAYSKEDKEILDANLLAEWLAHEAKVLEASGLI